MVVLLHDDVDSIPLADMVALINHEQVNLVQLVPHVHSTVKPGSKEDSSELHAASLHAMQTAQLSRILKEALMACCTLGSNVQQRHAVPAANSSLQHECRILIAMLKLPAQGRRDCGHQLDLQ